MIDRTHELPVTRQCQILRLARSTACYQPQPRSDSAEDLALMRRIDELHLEHPFAGARMLRDMLRREGHPVSRKRIGRLMKKMGIEALYRKPNLSRKNALRLKQLGGRLFSRTFDRQDAEGQIRAAIINWFTYLGMPKSVRAGQIVPAV